jgi:hypothetical protein
MRELIATYAIEHGISLVKAKHILVRDKVLVQHSAKSYSEAHNISIQKARKILNRMVEEGSATVDTNVIIDTTSRKKGIRSHTQYVRGNLFTFTNK